MPAERKPGMDHELYDWSPISTRPVLRWPNDARVALCIILNLEHFEWTYPEDGFRPANMAGLFHPPSTPWSQRQYGLRVGVFNVLEVLDRYGLKATVAIDAMTAEHYPFLVEQCKQRGYEFIGHGISMQRIITSAMNEEQERAYIRASLNAVEKASGVRPVGWFSNEYSESTRTPQLLAEEGIRYLCDWPNDEQPYKMKGREAYFLPTYIELDDVYSMMAPRFLPVMEYGQMLKDAFDTLYADGAKNGRVMTINLHPYLIGIPYRVKYLDLALEHMAKRAAVWNATGKEIIDWYAAHQG